MKYKKEDQSRLSPRPRRTYSLRRRLLTLLGGAFLLVLLVNGVGLYYLISQAEQLIWQDRQVEVARLAANTVADFIQRMHSSLVLTTLLDRDTMEANPQLLDDLLGQNSTLLELVRLDSEGQVFAGAYQDVPLLAKFNIQKSVWFDKAAGGQVYLSNIQILSGDPYLIMAIPAPDGGVVAARLRMNVLWDVVGSLGSGKIGQAYIVDQKGRVVAHSNPLVALDKTSLQGRPELEALLAAPSNKWSGAYVNFDNEPVIGSTFPVSGSEWVIIIEVSQAELSAISRTALLALGVGTALIGILAVVMMAWSLQGLIFRSVEQLQQGAERIGQGDLDYRLEIMRHDELGQVAGAFNQMANKLQESYNNLEQRGQRLEIVTVLGERLSSVLDITELLAEIVNQVKDSFGYYHVHIYLLDQTRENLLVSEGTGPAGAKMKAQGHSVSMNAPTSLVARAARTGKIISVDNVHEAAYWLPNPLLPNTHSEMAVPISLEGQVVGVLDVQEDKIAGLKGDDNLLRLLANHVAVAIRNAHLFTEVETALSEVSIIQEQYIQQAWEKVRVVGQSAEYQHQRPGASPLDKTVTTQLEQAARRQNRPAIVELNGHDIEQRSGATLTEAEFRAEADRRHKSKTQTALVAPIKVQNQTIGAIQLHETEQQHQWSEQELDLVQAVAEQVAQAAENLRLFEETRQRASYEHTVSEITQKIRQAPDLETLSKIATETLSSVLDVSDGIIRLNMGVDSSRAGRKQP